MEDKKTNPENEPMPNADTSADGQPRSDIDQPLMGDGLNRRDPARVAGTGAVQKQNIPPTDEQSAPQAEVSSGIDQAEDELRRAADDEHGSADEQDGDPHNS